MRIKIRDVAAIGLVVVMAGCQAPKMATESGRPEVTIAVSKAEANADRGEPDAGVRAWIERAERGGGLYEPRGV